MTLGRAFLTIVASTAISVLVGVGLGAFVGYAAPDFYAAWFRNGLPPGVNPVHIGIGNGVTGGAFGGIIIGLGLVAIFTWAELRREARRSIQLPDSDPAPLPTPRRSSDAVQRGRGEAER